MIHTTQAEVSGDLIDLSIGHPSPSLLPLELLRLASEHRFAQEDRMFLQYGYEPGDGYFREVLAGFLSERYGFTAVSKPPAMPVVMVIGFAFKASKLLGKSHLLCRWSFTVSADQLFVSNGVSQALDLICTLFTQPGDLIFTEEPSYFLALRIFKDHRLKISSVPTDESGIVLEALEERLARERPVFLYTVPTHQNPSGATLPLERRRHLLELSRTHRFLILADEVYHLLSYDHSPPPCFGCFCSEGNVFSVSSFSKILAPGLRLGWVHASPELLRPLTVCGMLDSGGGLNPFTSAVVRSVIEKGQLGRHLEHLRSVYSERRSAMGSELRGRLDGRLRFSEPWGGFFFWINLPETSDTQDLLPRAREHGVKFMPGVRFSTRGEMGQYLRLSFSYYDSDAIRKGVRGLAAAIKR